MEVHSLSLNQIKPPDIAVRSLADESQFIELRASMQEHGLIQPVVVVPEDDGYRLVVGDRRYKAAITLGWPEIDAVVADYTPEQVAVIRVHENAFREDPNPIDLATYLRAQMDKFGWTQGRAAQLVGKTGGWVSQTLKLLALDDDTKRMVAHGELSARHGYLAARLTKPETRRVWTEHWVRFGTSTAEAERQVQRWENNEDVKTDLAEPAAYDYQMPAVQYEEQKCRYCEIPLSQRPLLLRPVCDLCDSAILQGIKMAEELEGRDDG